MSEMRRILVTGGSGFVGQQVVEDLTAEPTNHVTVFDNFSFGGADRLPQRTNMTVVTGDLRDRPAVSKAVAAARPQFVVHLAAVHFIPYCNAHPEEAYEINVAGTKNLLDELAEAERAVEAGSGLKRLVFASTMAVYPITDEPIEESLAVRPLDIYGRTKALGEDLVELFSLRTGVASMRLRLSNVVGPGETNDHLFPAIARQVLAGAERIELGNLSPKRNYVHRRDVSAYVAACLELPLVGSAVANVGTRDELDVEQVVDLFGQAVERPIAAVSVPERRRQVERQRLQPDISHLVALTGRAPQFTVRQAIEELLTDLRAGNGSSPAP